MEPILSFGSLSAILQRMVEAEPIDTWAKLGFRRSGGDFLGSVITIEEAERWLAQFDEEDLASAVEIIANITYFTARDFRIMCRLALLELLNEHQLDLRSATFIPVGPTAKSGHLVSYFFRASTLGYGLGFSDPSSIAEKTIKDGAVVFIDDYVGTGDQFCRWWAASPFNTSAMSHIPQYFVAVVGTTPGLRAIREGTRVQVVCLQERWAHRDFDFAVIPDQDSFFQKYGSGLCVHEGRDYFLGYGDCRAGIVFFYNVPDNTVPIIWATGKNARGQEWTPLFKRAEHTPLTPTDGMSAALEQVSAGAKLTAEDILFLCELAALLRLSVELDSVSVPELSLLANLLSEFYWLVSGGDGLPLHPPRAANPIRALRRELIVAIARKACCAPVPSIEPLLSLFRLERFSRKQEALIAHHILRQIDWVLSQISEIHVPHCIAELLSAVVDADSWKAEFAHSYACRLVRKNPSNAPFTVAEVKALIPKTEQGQYNRLSLLTRLDKNWQPDLDEFLTPEVQRRIPVTVNAHGTVKRCSLSDWHKY